MPLIPSLVWQLFPTGLSGDLGLWVCYIFVSACLAHVVFHALRRGTNSWGASRRASAASHASELFTASKAAARGAQGNVDAPAGGSAESDADVLRAWREQCPELRALWDESKAMTAWKGVKFGKAGGAHAGRVVKIMLHDKRLTGDLPAALGELTALKTLHLDGNRLTSVPKELGGLTALTVLVLGGNQLTSVPEELGGLTALKTLLLNGNQLTSMPAEVGGLTALTWLNLRGNRLTSVPEELGGLTALKRLDLGGNQLTSMPAEWEQGGELEQSGCDIGR